MANNSQEALVEMQNAQAQAQNPNDILTGQRQQLGVNAANDSVKGLRGAIDSTTQLLKKVAPSVMGRTGSSLVTNAQATRQIANEQEPIASNLTDQTGKYNQAAEDAAKLEAQASQAAQGIYQGQQDKLSYLQNIYNNLFNREQYEEQKRQAEIERQASARGGSGGGGGGGFDLSGLMGGGSKPNYQQRGDKGFNFQDGSGKAISAGTYARQTGTSWKSLLTQLANAGDKGAKDVLKNGSKSKYWGNFTWGS